ncbi:hypothetical protein [Salibacterium aidingense]|uniref:hypothetical protein n=1 Tax=Salibacterium aidingense TaxID=384933 RepID=UPI003BD670A1
MNKKGLLIVFGVIAFVTGGLAAAGQMVKSSEEASPSFTGEYSVGADGTLAYVTESDGIQTLHVAVGEGGSRHVYIADDSKEIWAPVFNGEDELAFVETTGYPDAPEGEQEFQLEYSDVRTVSVEGGEPETVLQVRGVITDLVNDPARERWIVNGIHLHTDEKPEEGFIPYSSGLYTLRPDGSFEEIRSFDTYSPGSLQISEDGEKMLMILADDFENATPDSMFEATERIYEMEIDQPEEMAVVSDEAKDIPVSEVAAVDENRLLYQTIMNYGEGGTFEYDFVWYDRGAKEEGDRLHINEAVQETQLGDDDTWLYYVKRSRKSDQTEVFELFRYDLESGEEEKVKLPHLNQPSANDSTIGHFL